MARKAKPVTDTELQILHILWENAPLKIREIAEKLYKDCTSTEYGTVQSLLERLESKGYVKRDRSSFAHSFKAKVGRSAFLGLQLNLMASKMCEGSLTPLLMNLAQSIKLTKEEKEELLRLINNK